MGHDQEPLTLGRSLAGALGQGVVLPLLFVGGFLATTAVQPHRDAPQTPSPTRGAVEIRQQSERVPGAKDLIAAHDCWVSDAPADMSGKQPGHAVVTWPGDVRATYGGAWAVHVALEHTFDEPVPGFEVHAFCR